VRHAAARGAASLANAVLVWSAILVISFPMIWALLTSLKPKEETVAFPMTFWPQHLTLDAYARLLFDTDFVQLFLNTLYVAIGTMIVVLVAATLGAYGLTRFRFRGRDIGAAAILFTYFLPSTIIVIPIYLTITRIGLADTRTGLIIADTSLALPFALWMMKLFFETLPHEIEEAARTDGASRMAIFFEIALPQALPGLISAGIFTFIIAYNEYLFSFVFINTESRRTLTVGLMQIVKSSYDVDWNLLMAASFLMTLPVLAAIVGCQRYLLRGFGVADVKG
jgi:multiple sugar transport system permease protein